MRSLTILLLLLFSSSLPVIAKPGATGVEAGVEVAVEVNPKIEQLDRLFSDAFPEDQPGVSVIVVQGGETLLREGYGLADVELGVAIEPDMVFRIGSITKQFTAVLTMLLVDAGKIELDAPFQRYLSDYRTYDQETTVEHLLTHTSGIPSYTGLTEWRSRMREDFEVAEILDLFRELPLEFEPGSSYSYNNSGYILLGAMLEKVTGQSYEELVEERLFGPLGMNHSDYGNFGRVIPGRVRGYHRDDDKLVNAPYLSMTLPYAAGSLLSTVDDLATWNSALHAGKVLPAETLAKMWTDYRLRDGEPVGYGYGWSLGEYHGSRLIQHGGGIHGFSTYALSLPEQEIYVAVLSNDPQGSRSTSFFAELAADTVLGKGGSQRGEIELPAAKLSGYTGVYRIDEGTSRTVTLEDGHLYTQRSGSGKSLARASSEHEFFYDGSSSRFRFEFDEEGQVKGMVMTSWGGDEEFAEHSDEPLPEAPLVVEVDPAVYDRLAGEYELAPGFVLTVRRDGERLLGRATGQGEIEMLPSSELVYHSQAIGAELEFHAGEDGEIDAVVLRQGGREIEGKRIE